MQGKNELPKSGHRSTLAAAWKQPWIYPMAVWLLVISASRGELFTGPVLADNHVPALPLVPAQFAEGGIWHFACLLISALCILQLSARFSKARWRPLVSAALALVSILAVLGTKAWQGPIFFLDLAAGIGHWLLPLEEGDAGRLLSINGFWAASGYVAVFWPSFHFWRSNSKRRCSDEPNLKVFGLAVVGLSAFLLQEPGRGGSPFVQGHSEFLLFPSELAFVLVGIGAGLHGSKEQQRVGTFVVFLGLLWSTLVLLFPVADVDSVSLPLEMAFSGLTSSDPSEFVASVTLCGLALCLCLAWWRGFQLLRPRAEGARYDALRALSFLLVAHHLVAPFTAHSIHGGDLFSSWMVAALVLMLLDWGPGVVVSEVRSQSDDATRDSGFAARWDAIVVGLGLILYVALKTHAAGPSNTDENIYFYMAQRLGEGEWPYRDYFFAHPPLHVLVPGAVFAMFGFSITLAKLFTAAVGGVTLWTVWRIGREQCGRWVGVAAFIALLFATEFLKATSNMTGVNLTTMWLVLGVWQALRGNGVWAGALFGCAACTGFYAMGPICAVLVLLFFKNWKLGTRQIIAFALVGGLFNLGGYALGGDTFVDGVYRYHGLKKAQDGRMVPLFGAPDGNATESEKSIRIGSSGELELYNVDDGELLLTFDRVPGQVTSMKLGARGERLVVGTRTGRVACYNALTGAKIWSKRASSRHGGVTKVSIAPDGGRLVSGSSDGGLWLWDLQEGHRLLGLVGHRGGITSVAFSRRGQVLVSGSSAGELGIWDLRNGVPFDPNVGPGARTVAIQNLENAIHTQGPITSVDVSEEQGWLLSTSPRDGVVLRDLKTRKRLRQFGVGGDAPTFARFGPKAMEVHVGTRVGDITLLRTNDGTELARGRVHVGAVRSIRVSARRGYALSRGDDGDLRMWNVGQPEHSRSLAKEVVAATGGDVRWPSFPGTLADNVDSMVNSKPFETTVYYHPHLWFAFLLAPLLGLLVFFSRREGRSKPWRFFDPRRFFRDPDGIAAFVWLVAVALVLEFSMFRELYGFYFTLVLPFLALLLGYVIGRPLTLMWKGLTVRPKSVITVAVLTFSALSFWPTWMTSASEIFPREYTHAGQSKEYHWRLAPVAPHFSGLVKDLFWQDQRVTGHHERGVRHYLWTKKRMFRSLGEVADWLRARSGGEDTLAGASMSAPIIALEADLRIAAGEVDTNSKRFRTELLDEETYWNDICRDNVRYLISTNRSYFARGKMRMLPVVRKYFRPVKAFYDPDLRYGGRFPLCVYERTDPQGPCEWTDSHVPGPRRSPVFCPVE